MKKLLCNKWCKVVLLIISSFMLGGCFDYQELNDTNIINGIGVDYQEDKYIVNLEIIKFDKSEGNGSIKTEVVKGEGENFAQAMNEAIANSNKKVNLKHVNLLMISENLAKEEGINEVVDYMLRDVRMSSTFFTVVTANPEEVLHKKLENDSISTKIVNDIEDNIGKNRINNIDILVSAIINEKIDIALPYIELDEDYIIAKEITYFKGDKMIDKVDGKIYNFLVLDEGDTTFEANGTVINVYKKDIKYKVLKDKVVISLSGMGRVEKINADLNLEKYKTYQEVEDAIKPVIQEEVSSFLDDTLSQEVDLLGLKDLYYKKFKKQVKNIPYELEVEFHVNRNGAIYEAID